MRVVNPASVSMAQIESLKFLSGDKDYYPVSRAAAMDPMNYTGIGILLLYLLVFTVAASWFIYKKKNL